MKRRAVVFACFVGVGLGCSREQAVENFSEPLSTDLPDYLPTPAGYYHKSCIHQLENGEVVDVQGNVRRSDGTTRKTPPCRHAPRSLRKGGAGPPPIDSGWVEAGYWFLVGGWFKQMTANWPVPYVSPVYSYSPGQVLFLFPGLSPADWSIIIQPVLQYGFSAAGGGNYWAMASWFCDSGPGCFHSALVGVNPGDSLSGSLVASNCDEIGHCIWNVTTYDSSTGGYTNLSFYDGVRSYSVAFGGVLEVYGIRCLHYPNVGSTVFSNIALYDQNVVQVTPNWGLVTWPQNPSCGFGVTSAASSVALNYSVCAPRGAACQIDLDCCSDSMCNGTTCVERTCLLPGDYCTSDEQCCSGSCDLTHGGPCGFRSCC